MVLSASPETCLKKLTSAVSIFLLSDLLSAKFSLLYVSIVAAVAFQIIICISCALFVEINKERFRGELSADYSNSGFWMNSCASERCMYSPCLWLGGSRCNEDWLLVLTCSEDPPVPIYISRRLILQYFICSRPFQLQSLSRERCCVATTRCTSNSCPPTLRYCGIRCFVFRQAFCLLDTGSVPASCIVQSTL